MFLILMGMPEYDQHSAIRSIKQPVMRVSEREARVIGFQQTPNLECGVDAAPTSVISRDRLDRKVKVASVQERLLEQDDQGPV